MSIVNFMQSKQVEHSHELMYANELAFKYKDRGGIVMGSGIIWCSLYNSVWVYYIRL